uniref:Uncharacterized protein n=1 Tax=Acrobeloides nanus TaxID=290746 RepID=A0A914CF28_9BILA
MVCSLLTTEVVEQGGAAESAGHFLLLDFSMFFLLSFLTLAFIQVFGAITVDYAHLVQLRTSVGAHSHALYNVFMAGRTLGLAKSGMAQKFRINTPMIDGHWPDLLLGIGQGHGQWLLQGKTEAG